MTLLLLSQMPVSAVARRVGETDKRLWRMLHDHVAAAWPKVDWGGVVCVGCEEMSAHNGHHRAIKEVSSDLSPAYVAGVAENVEEPDYRM